MGNACGLFIISVHVFTQAAFKVVNQGPGNDMYHPTSSDDTEVCFTKFARFR